VLAGRKLIGCQVASLLSAMLSAVGLVLRLLQVHNTP
jgi:hypothetical protein